MKTVSRGPWLQRFRILFKREILIVPCYVFLAAVNAFAQSAAPKPSLPPGTLLESAPAFSKWIITISYADEHCPPPSPAVCPPPAYLRLRPRTVTTVKTKNIVHESIIAIDGSAQDKWYVGKTQYWKVSGASSWFVNQLEAPSNSYTPPPPNGFRDLAWVSGDTYICAESHAGRDCLAFRSNNTWDKINTVLAAWIDSKTRLPVEMQVSGEVRSFQFADPPTEMQSLPDDLKQEIEKGQKLRALLDLRAPTAP